MSFNGGIAHLAVRRTGVRAALIILTALVAIALLAGCYSDESANSGTASPAPAAPAFVYPAGVLSDATALPAIRGIFPVVPPDTNCCWVSKDVRFRVYADPDAKTVTVSLFVPDFDPWKSKPGAVMLIGPNGATLAEHALKPGAQDIVFPVAKGTESAGTAAVHLRFTNAYVPKDFHLNEDTRSIAVLLQKAAVQY